MFVEILKTVLDTTRWLVQSRAALLAENIVLCQQIIVLQRSVTKPRFRARERAVLALAARPSVRGSMRSPSYGPKLLSAGIVPFGV
jgi:hypothetical protein